ncbi:hypothetical protein COMA2_110043 [Candidatus Nitrospira nitrificans]|uniref:Uncharacterized protein n=2 Tax=Candidatus Nitrospira nitrificans TaxID=1742973 RepID=A0A0S4LA91_9BACT|nr:hypothetical protein COMA2_110043 [Candidatus Nitrospira nitrificans]
MHIMIIGKICEGSNEDFWHETGSAFTFINPRPQPDWIALSSPYPCEAPTWTGESGGGFPVSLPGVVVIRGKDMGKEDVAGTYRLGVWATGSPTDVF